MLNTYCISCGQELTNPGFDAGFGFYICQSCEETGNQMAALLEQGIELDVYHDDKKEIVKSTIKS